MNPYKILNIDHQAAQQEIIRAAALAMRERKFSGREIAVAQKELLNPTLKTVHAFLHFIDVKPLREQLVLARPDVQKVATLKRLTVFDEE